MADETAWSVGLPCGGQVRVFVERLEKDRGGLALLDKAVEKADWANFEKRRAEAKARGKLRGIGLASFIEPAGAALAPKDQTLLKFGSSGNLVLHSVTGPSGTPIKTVYTYDQAFRVTSKMTDGIGYSYTYDSKGNLTKVANQAGVVVSSNTFDAQGQLIQTTEIGRAHV